MKHLFILFFLLISCGMYATDWQSRGLGKKDFKKYWKVESESPDYSVTFQGDTAEIVSPKGLTLWLKEKMSGRVTIEYDARVVIREEGDRLSDLNCFWMASDPQHPDNLWKREKWRSGIFLNCYTLQLYYLGYGGNHNSTTRFRRYNGNEAGVTDAKARPAILKEYNDKEHLLEANRWYHIRITTDGYRTCYYINGERLVDFRDAEPLTEGWFGFRTTLSRTQIANFRYKAEPLQADEVALHWIGDAPATDKAVSFGVPFDEGYAQEGEKWILATRAGQTVGTDTWPLAYWPDGSVKWLGVAAVAPATSEGLTLKKAPKKSKQEPTIGKLSVSETEGQIQINTGAVSAYIPRQGACLIDSLLYGSVCVGKQGRLVCTTQSEPVLDSTFQVTFAHYTSALKSVSVERAGNVRAVVKLEGVHQNTENSREWLPFVVRLYFYAGSPEIKMVHSIVFDGDEQKDFIRALGVRFDVPLRETLYNRHVAFSCADGGVWSEPVQPLVGRRVLSLPDTKDKRTPYMQQQQMEGIRIPDSTAFNAAGRALLRHWASWDGYRLSQLTADAFSIRKRANSDNPWIGTFSGTRSDGYAFVGDVSGGLGMRLHDFWQSYPSSLEVNGAKSEAATLTAWLWSPEAEPMDLRHYDNVAHDLNASYEDVQPGLSTPYGVARTSTLTLVPSSGYAGKEAFAEQARQTTVPGLLMPVPEYLHAREAFGIWSLPDRSTPSRAQVEDRLDSYLTFYQKAIEQNKWYGFWHYGDVMHAYDPVRHTWRYDIGGFAWDNTELASSGWLWYSFLRTGRADIWRMAEAMTRHTCEVDVYHIGPNAGLGSRHNVSHWGCGAKEARISQAAWNRFYYYLTTDERCGDLMTEVKDAEQKLYTLDPMRLAQPREKYPCTAPARLRIGPDWIAYAGNWMTQWERTRDTAYRDKIIAGMKSIAALPSRTFTGPLALGFDPATGILTSECDPKLQATNHLMTIMGGFEIMNEMLRMIRLPEWDDTWLNHAANYKQKAWELNHNRFRISRLEAYAAWLLRDADRARQAWEGLWNDVPRTEQGGLKIDQVQPPFVPAPLDECPYISTNDAATWSLDAIYMQEVIPLDK